MLRTFYLYIMLSVFFMGSIGYAQPCRGTRGAIATSVLNQVKKHKHPSKHHSKHHKKHHHQR